MILKNIRYLVTQNSEREVLENVDLLVEDGKIAEIGGEIRGEGQETIDCSNKVVMPGLINAHTHVAMTLLRGISDNKILQDWLEEDIFPAEDRLTEDDVYYGSLLGIAEMLKTGTTCFNDMYFHMDSVAEAVEESGIRALLSRGMMDVDGGGKERSLEALKFAYSHRESVTVETGFAPHAVYTASEKELLKAKYCSEIFGSVYHIHVAETMKEVEDCIEEHGQTPVQYLESLGLLDEGMVAAHSTWLTERDIELMVENGAKAVHNPSANLKLGNSIARVPEMLEKDLTVAIGTDGAASNNSLNLFEEAKLAANLHKREDPRRITEQDVLDMLTVNGAEALGMKDRIGSLEPGKKADLVAVDLDRPDMRPVHGRRGVVSNIVYSFNGEVTDSMVEGDFVMRDRELVDIGIEKVLDEVSSRAGKFR